MLLGGVWYCLATEVPDALPLRMRVHRAGNLVRLATPHKERASGMSLDHTTLHGEPSGRTFYPPASSYAANSTLRSPPGEPAHGNAWNE